MSGAGAGDPDDSGRAGDTAPAGSETDVVRAAVDAVRRGEREAFGRVVERFQRRLFGLMVMMLRDPAAAEEVSQDAFVRAFVHLDRYDERRPFYPWLATIAVRLAQTWLLRRTRITEREGTPLDAAPDPAVAVDPLGGLIGDQEGRRLWESVAALPSGERTVVMLYYRQDMGVSDIARALGVSTGTVKTLLFRARQRLRRTIETAGDVRLTEES